MEEMLKYADVIVPAPVDATFTYEVGAEADGKARPGARAEVPFGRQRTYVGIIVRRHGEKPEFACRRIKRVLDDEPSLTPVQLELWRWMAEYYMAAPGDILTAALPAPMRSAEGYQPKTETYVRLTQKAADMIRLGVLGKVLSRAPAQRAAVEAIARMSRATAGEGPADSGGRQGVSRAEAVNEAKMSDAVMRRLVTDGYVETYRHAVSRINIDAEPHLDDIKPLSEEQRKAYESIKRQLRDKQAVLLHGVTSCGKTEIYTHLIRDAMSEGLQTLYLLPEIALTVQIRSRLGAVFGRRMGIYHSKYSDAERTEIWQKQLTADDYDVILGARSAVLLPMRRLGLIIIDEEHETSFKQQDPAPRYSARDTALMLARLTGARVVLGSATPSAESMANVKRGKYGYYRLTKRFGDAQLPEIRITDIRDLQRRKMMHGMFSPDLLAALRTALDGGRQAILFQNRRGYAPAVECRQCGWTPRCEHCDVSLTYHRQLGRMTCHYCGTVYDVPRECPCCGSTELHGVGYGTEKVEQTLHELLPEARTARMDMDTTGSRGAYERLIADFAARRTDILIGTQMVTKGLDFDNVAVVGILNADAMMNIPDFRAYEHAFAMITQVAGRAGRKGARGLVILQTKSADLPLIRQAVTGDQPQFYRDMMEERELFRYPPFTHIIYVYLRHKTDTVVAGCAEALAEMLRRMLPGRVLGPDKPAVARVQNMCIRKIMLKLEIGIDLARVRRGLKQLRDDVLRRKNFKAVTIYFDVDPL